MSSESSATSEHGGTVPGSIDIVLSDPSQLSALERWLTHGPAEVEVARRPGVPGPGEQGVLDVLTVLGGASGIVAAIRVLPDFIRSRRSGLRVEIVRDGRTVTLHAENVDEVMPLLERLLGE
ncbi:hypothetical protein ACFXAF_04060 [Kitasatospora sp. NPDC059463]|uniref:effector-associated constant component EACC1 n=1 Tax=unclassified Kitasatospora TaxID=2633591 RepID=UPI0036C115E8